MPLDDLGEDFLEYFDVFCPYADTNLTTVLEDAPHFRQIAAQLLVRRVAMEPPFQEDLIPMEPHGELVLIARNWLKVGGIYSVPLKYTYISTSAPPRLVLESQFTRVTLLKWSSSPGDVRSSWVTAPLRYYDALTLERLANEYGKLVKGHKHSTQEGP
jgi:hypothetical protein